MFNYSKTILGIVLASLTPRICWADASALNVSFGNGGLARWTRGGALSILLLGVTVGIATTAHAQDCNSNGIPDSCDLECGLPLGYCRNNWPQTCGQSEDCNESGIPDECEDCNSNGIPDSCDLANPYDCGSSPHPCWDCAGCDDGSDCNDNDVPDECDIADGTSLDCTANGIPDECEEDCNSDGVPDVCDIAECTSEDCNSNGVPDECEEDCNDNGVPDDCEMASTWVSVGCPSEYRFHALALDVTDPLVAYAAAGGSGNGCADGNGDMAPGCDIFKTTDGGFTWTSITDGVPDVDGLDARALAVDGQRLYAATLDWGLGERVLRSLDGGSSWEASYVVGPYLG